VKVNDQQIYTALELADHEVRLLIGEFRNTRLNILKVEKVKCSGIEGVTIVDQDAVVTALKSAVNNASANVGARIQRVLLLLPSWGMKRYSRRVQVPVDRKVSYADVRGAIREALKTELPENLEVINTIATKYTINGIGYRRLPVGEECTSMGVDVDLICADKEMTFEYAQVVEKAGLDITDVSLDGFAISKEASLMEKSVEQFVILLRAERQTTTLTLFAKGRLISSEILLGGSDALIAAIIEEYRLPIDVAERLLYHNCRLGLETYPDSPIFLWANEGKTATISENRLIKSIAIPVEEWVRDIKRCCEPILTAGSASLVLTGEASEIIGFDKLLEKTIGIPTEIYIPETLGVRSASMSAVVGLFYALKDQLTYRQNILPGINMEEFHASVDGKKDGGLDDTLTRKLKGILFESRGK
jgi:cell division protein FtsA